MKTWYGKNCSKCKGFNEPYMVTDKIFKKGNKSLKGFLCISCLEFNLGRKLKLSDFTDYPINKGIFGFDAKSYIKYGKRYLEVCRELVKKDIKGRNYG